MSSDTDTDIDQVKREVRNKLRRYSLDSILNAALSLLHRRFPNPGEEMQTAPWLILLMAEWALEDKMVYANLGKVITAAEFVGIQQLLWNMGGKGKSGLGTTNIVRYLRSLAYVQMQFQRLETFEFVRWPALVGRLPAENPVRQDFETRFGLTPEDLLDLVFAIYSQFLKGQGSLTPDYFGAMHLAYGEKLNTMLGLLSRDVPSLRDALTAEGRRTKHSAQAVLEFPVFKRFPLVRALNGIYYCWHPKVFARAVDEFVHTQLVDEGSDYSRPYSEVFEEYVVELSKTTELPNLDEQSFWDVVGTDKHAVEIILRDGDCNVFVEAKFGLYQDEYITLDDVGYAKAKLKKLREGVTKAADVSARISTDPRLADFALRQKDFLLLVTNRNLHLPTGGLLQSMSSTNFGIVDERVRLQTTDKLPVENVFILSLEEFELLMTVVSKNGVRLSELLPKLATSVAEPTFWRMEFKQLAEAHMPPEARTPVIAPLMRSAIDDSIARLAVALNQPASPSVFDNPVLANSDAAPKPVKAQS